MILDHNIEELIKSIDDSHITLISSTLHSKVSVIINLLNTFSILNNKKTKLYSFGIRSEYYSRKLISFLSGIDSKLITKYYFPYHEFSKHNKEKIDQIKFIDAIEKIQNSKILMSSEKAFENEDYVDSILEKLDSDILIIDDFNTLLYKTKYSLQEVLKKLNQSAKRKNCHIALFISKKTPNLDQFKSQYPNYIDNFMYMN